MKNSLHHSKEKRIDNIDTLFKEYSQSLFYFACKFVDSTIAKDLVQDLFYKLWRDKEKLTIHTSTKNLLFTMMKNRCLNYLKSDEIKEGHKNHYGYQMKINELYYFTNQEKSLIETETREKIKTLINHLPEQSKNVFKLRFYEQMGIKEIAIRLDMSEKTVEKHITKSRKYIKEYFMTHTPIYIFIVNQILNK